MKYTLRDRAVLVLEDGTIFDGYSCGFKGMVSGEICFNTSMTGYQEIFTDPSYYGQILIMNTSHIGNYGVQSNEVESDQVMISGLVCNQISHAYYSRPSGEENLNLYLQKNKIVGISDIDTRKLVRHIRAKGAMNAIISSSEFDPKILQKKLQETPSMAGLNLASKVSTTKPYFFGPEKAKYKVAVLDFGVKRNILRCLEERDCFLKVFPIDAKKEDILSWKPDGIMLSNGPGDPESLTEVIDLVSSIIKNETIPVFGICLGHQIIALSQGVKTTKMHHGHRGVNHPIINKISGKGEITSQNHGFVIEKNTLTNEVEVTHMHLNDETIAGIRLKNKPVFSVQYHPESSAGPNDSRYLFDQFIESIKKYKS